VEEISLMKKFAFVLAMSMVVAGSAYAVDPILFVGGGGDLPYEPGDSQGVVCHSQAPNLGSAKISDEIIGAVGLETEIANDFLASASGWVDGVRWWGGYYNWVQGDPQVTSFNITVYGDDGCVPAGIVCEYVTGNNGGETYIGNDVYGWPTYEYSQAICCPIVGDNLYWISTQAGDHLFPPQWGAQGTDSVLYCDAVFKSAYFSYPDWTPAGGLVGAPWDAAFEVTCADEDCGVATETNSWGAIKGLYR
jgi:hypothetical protein